MNGHTNSRRFTPAFAVALLLLNTASCSSCGKEESSKASTEKSTTELKTDPHLKMSGMTQPRIIEAGAFDAASHADP